MPRAMHMFIGITVAASVLAVARLPLADSPADNSPVTKSPVNKSPADGLERRSQGSDVTSQATPEETQEQTRPKPLPENLRWVLDQRDAAITRARLDLAAAAFELVNAETYKAEAMQLYQKLEEMWWGFKRTSVDPKGLDVPRPPRRPDAYVMANAIRDAARRFEAALSNYFLQRQIIVDTYDLKLLGLCGAAAELYEVKPLPTTETDPLVGHACQRLMALRRQQSGNPFTLVQASRDHRWKAPSRWLPVGVVHADPVE